MRFWADDTIDMTQITDSMQLDSNTEIAGMEFRGITASLEVRGDVKVWWNPNAKETDSIDDMFTCGDYYRQPSDFPQELKDLIKETPDWDCDPRVYVSENNWFELFLYDDDGYIGSDLVDVEGYTLTELFDFLHESIGVELLAELLAKKN